MRKNEVHKQIKLFKFNLKHFGEKYAIKRLYMYLRGQKRMFFVFARRYGWVKLFMWSTPLFGTVLLLSELENKGFRLASLQNRTDYNENRIFELEKEIEALKNG